MRPASTVEFQMARQLRRLEPDGTYHVFSNATFGRRLFVESDDRHYFERRLFDVVTRFEWSCLAHCVLGTHYHLLVTTPQPNLDAGMHRLNGMYAQSFNHRHDQYGRLFRDRYSAVLVESDAHLLWLFRYLALNPVQAGVCRHPAEWRWSSYPGTIGWSSAPPFIDLPRALNFFAKDPRTARNLLRDFVEGSTNGSLLATAGG
jgi:REP element-mobilizing transposase RayT